MKNIILALLMMICISYSQAQTFDNAYVTDLSVALRLSKETKQNIVLVFSASWCGHCKNLKNDLPTIEGFDNKIICILDSDNEKKTARQFKVKSLPTSIMLNSNGEEISRTVGYDKESYQKWLKSK